MSLVKKMPFVSAVTMCIVCLGVWTVGPEESAAADATYYVLQDKSGKHKIVYEMANMLGKSQFNYNGHVFSGSEIRRKSVTDLGETISVTAHKGKHGDSTTITLVLPRVSVEQDTGTKIKTVALSTIHIRPANDHKEQQDVYHVINLIGLALSGPPAEPKK